jgi:hypothetical protein
MIAIQAAPWVPSKGINLYLKGFYLAIQLLPTSPELLVHFPLFFKFYAQNPLRRNECPPPLGYVALSTGSLAEMAKFCAEQLRSSSMVGQRGWIRCSPPQPVLHGYTPVPTRRALLPEPLFVHQGFLCHPQDPILPCSHVWLPLPGRCLSPYVAPKIKSSIMHGEACTPVFLEATVIWDCQLVKAGVESLHRHKMQSSLILLAHFRTQFALGDSFTESCTQIRT